MEDFARLFEEHHFPLYAPYFDYLTEEEEPAFTALRRGIPFDLQGIGYEGLHEMWDGYRDGLPALALLAKPPESFYTESDEIRVAWLESASAHISQDTLLRIPEGGIPQEALTEAVRSTRFEASSQGVAWVWAETGNFFLDTNYEDGMYDGFADPWDDEVIAEGTEEVAKGQGHHGRGVQTGRLAGGRALQPLRRDAGLQSWNASATQTRLRRKTTMSEDTNVTEWSLPGQMDVPRDKLRVQLEVYEETILAARLRGGGQLGEDRLGGRYRQRVHPAPGVLLGAPAQ